MYRSARENPHKFYIGADANRAALEKVSMKATRKPQKGGAPNALFVHAAVEALPEEFDALAAEVHIHFPWGSLLRAVAAGDETVLRALRGICAPRAVLEIRIGIDPVRDRSEIERLGLPALDPGFFTDFLVPRYEAAGFELSAIGSVDPAVWSRLETTWARKLHGADGRTVSRLLFRASSLLFQ